MNRKGGDDAGRKKKSDKKKDPPASAHKGKGANGDAPRSAQSIPPLDPKQARGKGAGRGAQQKGTMESLDAPKPPPKLFGNWTGKTPATMLHEWCQRNKWAKPMFSPVNSCKEGFKWRVVLHNLNNKKTEEKYTYYTRDPMEVSDMARHAAAVVALHALCSSKPLHQLLPPEMRGLWAQLSIDAKEKQEVEAEKAKKAEEIKEKKDNLEKRLQKLPQIYMSPTARSLIENIIKNLRSNQPIQRSTVGEAADESYETSNDLPSPEEAMAERDAVRALRRKLKQIGWRKDDIDRALAEVPDLPTAHDFKGRLKRVLDWLTFHVSEENLPVEYRPAKTLEIGISAFSRQQQAASPPPAAAAAEAEVDEDETEELKLLYGDVSSKDRASDLYKLFAKIASGSAEDFASVRMAVVSLPKKDEEREEWEINELRHDEVLALEAILGEDFSTRTEALPEVGEVTVIDIRVAPDTLEGAASTLRPLSLQVDDLRIEFHIPAFPDSRYPLQLPLVLPNIKLSASKTNKLEQSRLQRIAAKIKHCIMISMIAEAKDMLGDPMIYSLLQSLQSTAGNLLRQVVEVERPPTVAAIAPTPAIDSTTKAARPPAKPDAGSAQRSARPTTTLTDLSQLDKQAPSPKKRSGRAQPVISEEKMAEISQRLAEDRKSKIKTSAFAEMQRVRQRLPAATKREEIVRVIRNHQVIVLTGATGCGKSTQVPQYILEDMIEQSEGAKCNIVVTQPRRISALGLAQRVAAEQCEEVGSTVGYQIRLEAAKSQNTRLLFCTTGILLRRLSGAGGEDRELRGISHIIVDEVHERNLDSDFLLIVLKELVRARKDIKVILMSATLDAELFAQYFASGGKSAPIISIPGFTYPVAENYLEDIFQLMHERGITNVLPSGQKRGAATKRTKAEKEEEEKRREEILRSYAAYSMETREALASINENKLDPSILESLIFFICEEGERVFPELKEERGTATMGAILVFFSGMADILNMLERLQRGARERRADGKYLILPLHSSISTSQQQRVFERPPPGVRKIILSTNIAETSVTIDDVVVVIDTGKMNEMQYDPVSKLSSLGETWIAKANAAQRRGRAGRVKKGLCFKLYTERRHNSFMEQRPPEMLRVPLEQLCLQIKLLSSRVKVKQFLHQALQPPEDSAIESALSTLHEVSALEKGSEQLTPLGYHLAQLPVDVHIGKMMLFGAILCCLDPVLTIAAAMSAGKSPFFSPLDRREEANQAKLSLASEKSDHLTLMNAYNGWLSAKAEGREASFCNEKFLSRPTLQAIVDLKRQYAELLSEIGFLDQRVSSRQMSKLAKQAGPGSDGVREATGRRLNAHSKNGRLIKAALCCGLYPNVVRISSPETKYVQIVPGAIAQPHEARDIKFFTRYDGRVFLHPSSVNFAANEFESPWLLFSEKVQTSKVFIRQASMVSHYPLLLFGREIDVEHHLKIIKVDDWIQFRADPRIAVLTKELKVELDKLLAAKINDPTLDIGRSGLIDVIVQLISTDGLIGPQEAALWT